MGVAQTEEPDTDVMDTSELKGKKVTVIGAARSGLGAARLLHAAGVSVFVSDHSPSGPLTQSFMELKKTGIAFEAGGHTARAYDADLMVISPGVPSDAEVIREAGLRGIRVVSEIEMASWFCAAKIAGITGTNGKTTTVTLLGRLLADARIAAAVAGNIGTAFSGVAADAAPDSVVVLEVSSFQLDHIDRFRPSVSVILNITPDHLNRYGGSFERYARSKCRIFENQRPGDALIYNSDDAETNTRVARLVPNGVKLLPFGLKEPAGDGAFVRDGTMVVRLGGRETPVVATGELGIPGLHNLYNSMAASLAAFVLGVSAETAAATLRGVQGGRTPARIRPGAPRRPVRQRFEGDQRGLGLVRPAVVSRRRSCSSSAGGTRGTITRRSRAARRQVGQNDRRGGRVGGQGGEGVFGSGAGGEGGLDEGRRGALGGRGLAGGRGAPLPGVRLVRLVRQLRAPGTGLQGGRMGVAVTEMKPPRTRNHIDFATLVAVITLMLLSMGIVYSASSTLSFRNYKDSEQVLVDHVTKIAAGLAALFIMMRFDYHRFRKLTKPALIAAIGLLTLTLLVGAVANGAIRWIPLGPLRIQPSEFAKYALLFHLCTLISVKGEMLRDFRKGFVPMMVWIGLVAALVILQPNFSMAAIIVLLSMVMLFVGGVRFKHLAMVAAPVVPAMVGILVLEPYRVKRIEEYIEAVLGEFGKGAIPYQLRQGLIAFGRGGIFGVGPGESRQRDLFLPEAHTDFVYSIIGEEYGFVGTMFFMLLFLMIMVRGYKIARYAPDVFGRNLAIAITSTVTLYALVNAGVTLGLLPTTGLPMPFVSFGGSSMLFTAAAVGVLLNISSQTDLHPRATQVPVVGSVNAGKAAVGKVY